MKDAKSAKLPYSPLVKAGKFAAMGGVMLVDIVAIPVWVGCTGGTRRHRSGLRALTGRRVARPPAGSADDGGRAPVSRRRHIDAWRAGNRYAEERRKGLAPVRTRTGVPGSPIRGAETRIVCVDAMEWRTRAGSWTRSIDVHPQGKLRHWRQCATETDGE